MSPALLLFLALQAPGASLCPPKLHVNQQLAAPLPGWTATSDGLPNQLAGITFYEGPPEQEASLAPDSESRPPRKYESTWNFTGATWIACHYSGASLMLTKQLTKATRSCTVSFIAGETIAGLPAIQKIECR